MSKLRIRNATLFVTVMSACLGLMAAGASSQAHQTASTVLSEIVSVTGGAISYRHASNRALKRTARYHSHPQSFMARSEDRAAVVSRQSTLPPIARDRILVITSLARASLEDSQV
jgi:hypothetical protein